MNSDAIKSIGEPLIPVPIEDIGSAQSLFEFNIPLLLHVAASDGHWIAHHLGPPSSEPSYLCLKGTDFLVSGLNQAWLPLRALFGGRSSCVIDTAADGRVTAARKLLFEQLPGEWLPSPGLPMSPEFDEIIEVSPWPESESSEDILSHVELRLAKADKAKAVGAHELAQVIRIGAGFWLFRLACSDPARPDEGILERALRLVMDARDFDIALEIVGFARRNRRLHHRRIYREAARTLVRFADLRRDLRMRAERVPEGAWGTPTAQTILGDVREHFGEDLPPLLRHWLEVRDAQSRGADVEAEWRLRFMLLALPNADQTLGMAFSILHRTDDAFEFLSRATTIHHGDFAIAALHFIVSWRMYSQARIGVPLSGALRLQRIAEHTSPRTPFWTSVVMTIAQVIAVGDLDKAVHFLDGAIRATNSTALVLTKTSLLIVNGKSEAASKVLDDLMRTPDSVDPDLRGWPLSLRAALAAEAGDADLARNLVLLAMETGSSPPWWVKRAAQEVASSGGPVFSARAIAIRFLEESDRALERDVEEGVKRAGSWFRAA